MRLTNIAINSFRGIRSNSVFDLNKDIVLISGRNGTGKTSLIDAIKWVITGEIDRLKGSRDFTVYKESHKNIFSDGNPTVALNFEVDDSSYYLVRRGKRNGKTDFLILLENGNTIPETELNEKMNNLFPKHVWNNFIILEQEKLSNFIIAKNPRTRYDLFIKFLGLITINELRERIKQVKNYLDNDKLKSLQNRILELDETRDSIIEHFDKEQLYSRLQKNLGDKLPFIDKLATEDLIYDFERQTFRLTEPFTKFLECSYQLSVNEVSAIRNNLHDQVSEIKYTESDTRNKLKRTRGIIDEFSKDNYRKKDEIKIITKRKMCKKSIDKMENQRKRIRIEIEKIRSKYEQIRRELSNQDELSETYSNFIIIGYNLIEDRYECPLCKTKLDYDLKKELNKIRSNLEKTRNSLLDRLEYAKEERNNKEKQYNDLKDKIRSLNSELSEIDLELADITAGLSNVKRQALELTNNIDKELTIEEMLTELKILEKSLRNEDDNIKDTIETLKTKIEVLDIILEFTSRSISKKQYSKEENSRLRSSLVSEYKISLVLSDYLEEVLNEILQNGERSLFRNYLSSIDDFLQAIYYKLDPHPYFKEIIIEPEYNLPKGELYLKSEIKGVKVSKSVNLRNLFSTTQNNILALSVFIATNWQTKVLAEKPLILDDPIQSLDSQNTIKLVELLISLSKNKQIIVTTSSESFTKTLKNNFKFLTNKACLINYLLYDWSEKGPMIKESRIESYDGIRSIKRYLESID